MVNIDRLKESFIGLVTIDSPSRSERQIADFLTKELEGIGLQVREDEAGAAIGTKTGNLIAWLAPTAEKEAPIFFSAHMDTVEPGRGVKVKFENGRFSSEGETILGGDDKGGISTILEALRIVQEEKIPHGGIEIIFTVGEEIGLLGAKHIKAEQLKAKKGFVLDAAGAVGDIITRGPAQIHIKAGIIGKAAHAGVSPEEGISAIEVVSHAISKMTLGRIDSETTANIGVIQGGKATNIVPELVNIEGEVRSLDPLKMMKYGQDIITKLEETAKQFGARAVIQVEDIYPEISLGEEDAVVRMGKVGAEVLGIQPRLLPTGGGSDANIFNGYGLPTVNLGIGMKGVHTTEETMDLEDLVKTTKLIVEIIKIASGGQKL